MCVALCRQMLWRMLGADHRMEAHQVASRSIYWMGKSADAREGVQAFLEKRPASFTLRPSADMPEFYPWWEERKFRCAASASRGAGCRPRGTRALRRGSRGARR